MGSLFSTPSRFDNSYGFHSATTAAEVCHELESQHDVNVEGRVVLITGCTNGIGLETARALMGMRHPPTLVMANRNRTASLALRDELLALNAAAVVHVLDLNLDLLASVRECAAQFAALELPLNYLILNAGIFSSVYALSPDGLERHFQVNHLSQFLLTNLLLPNLIESAQRTGCASRVVVVSSHAHYNASMTFASDAPAPTNVPPPPEVATGFAAGMLMYGQSKLCNVLFANELERRMVAQGSNVHANSLHPASMTPSNIGETTVIRMMMAAAGYFARTLPQAASTSVYCALAPELESNSIWGHYFDKCRSIEAAPITKDPEIAAKLWALSEKLAGIDNI